MNLLVSNLAPVVTEGDLQRLFVAYGKVTGVTLLKDKVTGERNGTGVVTMPELEEARAASLALDGVEWNGRLLAVEELRRKTERGLWGPPNPPDRRA